MFRAWCGRTWLYCLSHLPMTVQAWPIVVNHVWSYDFVQDRTHDGHVYQMLCIIDEFTRACLSIRVERRLNSQNVLEQLSDLFLAHGPPKHIRSDNGPEFIATAVREWPGRLGVKTLHIEPGSPWESFNSKLRDEFLDQEIVYTLREAQNLIEWWMCHYN